MNNTGKKFGGRKAGTPNKSKLEIRELLDLSVDFASIVGKLYELSQGVAVKVKGKAIVYDVAPDPTAAKILLEYRYGRPRQRLELNDEPETVQFIIGIHKNETIHRADGTTYVRPRDPNEN